LNQHIQDALTILAGRGNVASELTENVRTLATAKATRNFLLDFDHAHIAFGQIIIKRDRKVTTKCHDFILVSEQTVQ
jgi:hypothetical protein